MIDFRLKDGHGGGNYAKVNGEGELTAVIHPHPPRDEVRPSIPVTWDFENSAGSNDMQVSASAASPEPFFICAETEKDRYVKSMFVTISDAGAALNQFGAISALTNGCRLIWVSQSVGETVINDSIKTNWEWVNNSWLKLPKHCPKMYVC